MINQSNMIIRYYKIQKDVDKQIMAPSEKKMKNQSRLFLGG